VDKNRPSFSLPVLPTTANPVKPSRTAICLADPPWSNCLALAGKYYTNIRLGDETLFGSPGAGAGTYSSRVGVGAMVRLLRATGKWLFRCLVNLFY